MFKATLRIPCAEPYAYIEIAKEFESNEDVIAEYNKITSYLKDGPGLSSKDFNNVVDTYLTEGDMESEDYAGMSTEQKNIVQTIKRSIKRIKAHQNETL